MMTNKLTMISGVTNMNNRTSSFLRYSPHSAFLPRLIPRATLPSLKLSSRRNISSLSFSAASTSPFSRKIILPRASRDLPSSFRFPAMDKKPEFWWRVLACIAYLMPLHETWMFAEAAYNIHPFLECLESVSYPFIGFICRLPSWFFTAYFFVGYVFIVRRREWPHFFRFHMISGMLLDILLQALGTASRWMPKSYYYGMLGMHFWLIVAFAHLFTTLECIRCAVCGMYADVPFVSDAAYIQMPYD